MDLVFMLAVFVQRLPWLLSEEGLELASLWRQEEGDCPSRRRDTQMVRVPQNSRSACQILSLKRRLSTCVYGRNLTGSPACAGQKQARTSVF